MFFRIAQRRCRKADAAVSWKALESIKPKCKGNLPIRFLVFHLQSEDPDKSGNA